MTDIRQVGFIGIGRMGRGMVLNLVRAGFGVAAWNRSAIDRGELADAGVRFVDTPAQAARSGLVVSMVADDAALDAVSAGEAGVLAGLPAGGLHVSMSTVGIEASSRWAQRHHAAGRAFLAAPVFGRPDAAAAAKLWIVAAGADADYARATPLFEAMGQGHFHVGSEPQQANVVKLAGNFMIISAIETLGEAFALAANAGVAPELLLQIVNGSLFKSPIYENYGRLALERRFDPAGFMLKLGLKDASLVLDAAERTHTPMPFASAARDHLLSGVTRGLGDLDLSALTRVIAENAGLK